MLNPDYLADDLRRAVPPGATVHWVSPAAMHGVSGVIATGAMIAAFPIAALQWLTAYGDTPPGEWTIWGMGVWEFCLAYSLGLMFLALRAWRRAIVITDAVVMWRYGLSIFPLTTARRADIARATGFEASSLVLLHRADGKTARLAGVPKIREFLHALGVPAELWPAREEPAPDEWPVRLLVNGSVYVPMMMMMAIQISAMITGNFGSLWRLFWVSFLALSVSAIAWAVGHWMNGRRLNASHRQEIACHMTDSQCRGHESWTAEFGGRLALPVVLVRRWVAHKCYGIPDDCRAKLPPEIINPSTPPAASP